MTEDTKKVKSPSSARLEKLMKEESKLVKGVFRFHECPGGTLQVPMKKYRGNIYNLNLKDGEEAEVPLWVARYLNGYDILSPERGGKIDSCGYKIHENAVDKSTGRTIVQVGQVRRRMAFESTEFMTV